MYCEQRERTSSLIQTGARLRSDIDWPELNGGIREQSHGIPVQEWPALARVLTTLDDIHARLTTGVDGPSPEKRAAVEAHTARRSLTNSRSSRSGAVALWHSHRAR